MADLAPELLEKIQKTYAETIAKDKQMAALVEKLERGAATYQDAHKYADKLGRTLSNAYRRNVSSRVLPNGRMYYNIAEKVIPPTIRENYDRVAAYTEAVQTALNEEAGIGIRAQVPEYDKERTDGIVDYVSDAEDYDSIADSLLDAIEENALYYVAQSAKDNFEFQGQSGLRPRIVRTASANCCNWCAELEGRYSYPEVPQDVYRRHAFCKCSVEYEPGDGRRQNVHSKVWAEDATPEKIEERKRINPTGIQWTPRQREFNSILATKDFYAIREYLTSQWRLMSEYTPDTFREALSQAGYEITPLGQGAHQKKDYFTEGGGYRGMIDAQSGILYHPTARSHHDGAYYKLYGHDVEEVRCLVDGFTTPY